MSDGDEETKTYDWSAHYDAEGNLYYHNSVSDETTWDAPDNFNPPEEEPAKTQKDGGDDDAWEKHEDEEGSVYYYNTVTEVTTWDKPEGFKEEEGEGAAVKEEDGEKEEESKLPSSPNIGGGEDGGDVKMEDAKDEENGKGEWEKHEDDEGAVYYYNAATEETTWDKPIGFNDEEKVAAVKEEEETKLPSSPVSGDDDDGAAALPSSPVGGPDEDKNDVEDGDVKMEDVKEGEDKKAKGSWEKLVDDEGTPYYFNSETDVTQWEQPEDYEEADTASSPKKEEEAAPEEESEPSPKKKSGWEKITDNEGRVYYYNAVTEETTWDKPDDCEEGDGDKAEAPAETESEAQPAAATGKEGAWQKLTDDEGREYYYNASTETTQWEQPNDYVEESSSSPKPEASPSKGAAGSAGQWEKYTDDENRTYFYNATSGETQWEAPEGFVDQDEKKADEDDEFQASPTRSPSPSAMSEDEEKEPEVEQEPEPEPEPEIDPAVKRVMDAEEALGKADSVMEPGCTADVLEVVGSQGGNPEKAIKALIENYQGTTAICGIVAKWLADLRASSMKVQDVNAIVGTATHSVADGIRSTAQDIVSVIAKERFTTAAGQGILQLSKSEAAFLGEMIESGRWRKLLIDLAATNKDDALLMYCIRTISKRGFHRELVKRMNPSEYYAVFNSMLQSEVCVVGKTAISASNDVDTSIGLEELVNDLRRTCTATSYTYLYSIEVLRTLVTMAEEDEEATHGTKRTRFRRAIRKWERLSQDLDFAMVDPSTSASTAGSSALGRKRRLDVALTVSELHQRQRRRLRPSGDSDVVIVANDQQRNSIETGLLNFLRRFSVGTQVDDRILDALLPTGLNMQAAAEEIGELLITYPLAIRALLSHMFRTGGTTRVPPSTKSKCARLVALAVLASEKKARAEIGERRLPDEESPDEVALTRMLTQGSQLCEDLALTASFVVTKTGKERGALVSPGQTLCNLALKCASVAQGVMIWADDCIKQSDFTASATYPTFSPSILTIVRILALRHPCTRLEAAEIAFTFLRHSTSGEMSYKKINEIKEQSIRLLLFLVVRGEAPTVLRTLTTQLQQEGEVLKMDGSLLRYLVTGMLDIVKPPISVVFVRLFGAVLKTPRCIDALLSVYFKQVYKDKLKKLLLHFHKACSPAMGTATPADVKLVGHLIRTYSVKK